MKQTLRIGNSSVKRESRTWQYAVCVCVCVFVCVCVCVCIRPAVSRLYHCICD